jgi:hypothetical protein
MSNTNILTNKLNEFGDQGRIYQIRSTHMKKLTLIENKNKKGEDLTPEEIKFLYEFDEKIQGFGHVKDPRIEEIIKNRNFKNDIATVFNYRPEQISTTKEEALYGNFVFHYGDLDLRGLKSLNGITIPQHIGGSLFLNSLTSAEGLIFPHRIDGSLNLDSLTSTGRLILPKHIGGDLLLSNLMKFDALLLPDYIKGSLVLSHLTSAKGLKLPSYIGELLWLHWLTSAEGLNLPKDFPLEKLSAPENVLNELRSR